MEIPNSEKVKEWFFECLYTDNFINKLDTYQIEKVYLYAIDFEHELKPSISEIARHKLKTREKLADNPMRENVIELIRKLKSMQSVLSEKGGFEGQSKDENWTKNMKFYLMNEFGFFSTSEFKDLSKTGQKKLITKILDCNDRTAQAFLNGDEKYLLHPNNKAEVEKLVKLIKGK